MSDSDLHTHTRPPIPVRRASPADRATHTVVVVLVSLVTFSLLLAGCSLADSDSESSSERFQEVDMAIDGDNTAESGDSGGVADVSPSAGREGETEDETTASPDDSLSEPDDPQEESGGGGNIAVPAEIAALAVGRQIIFTGDVVVESADVSQTTADVVDAVFAAGGAIWGQDTRTSPEPQTVLTIRVPPGDFDRVLDAIAGLEGSSLVSQSVSTDDVTDAVVDLDARIIAAESSVGRVQELLDKATDLNTVFSLEEELATRQADLERLRGQRKTIGDQITLATITLTILELDPDRLTPEMEVVAWVGENVDDACPGVTDLSIGADDSAVLCVNVSNTGDDVLTDIDVQSPTFRLRVGDFEIKPGDAEDASGDGSLEALAPGQELLLYAELDAEDGFIARVDASRTVRIVVAVSATPETTPTIDLTGEDEVFLSADVDDPLPGFGDSFSRGLGAMLAVLSVAMIAVGVLLPFVPLLLLVWWLVRRIQAKARSRQPLYEYPDGPQQSPEHGPGEG